MREGLYTDTHSGVSVQCMNQLPDYIAYSVFSVVNAVNLTLV